VSRAIAALFPFLCLLLACRGGETLAWRVDLGPSLAGQRVIYVEGRILRGGCDGVLWYEGGRLVGSGTELATPDALDDGVWGFEGRASDESCQWFATGCVERRIPDDTSPVVVTVERQTPPYDARCADCEMGICGSDPLPPPRIVTPAPGGYFFDGVGAAVTPTFRFEPARGATRHVVEVSARCGTRPVEECDFDAPAASVEVSGTATTATLMSPLPGETIPPVGARYAVRIQACDSATCSASRPRAFHVGRQPSDVNGDSLGDAVIGAPGINGAYTLFGNDDLTIISPFEVPGSPRPSRGAALAFGDLDGDGFSDLLLGAPFSGGAAVDVGFVSLYPGTAAGPQADVPVAHPEPIPASTFGSALAVVGDVDGDGYDDFAVGAPQHGRDAGTGGAVFLFYGAADLSGTLRSERLTAPESIGDGRFGQAVTGGDLDGDGYADVVVGAPRAGVGALTEAGRVWYFRGPAPAAGGGVEIEAAPADMARFGAALAIVGDLDGDGRADLVVGAPGAGGGGAYLYLGDATGIAPGRVDIPNAAVGDARFGARVAGLGDVDGDSVPDLAIGAPDHDGNGGAFVYSGADRASSWLPSPILDSAPPGSSFGAGLAGIGDADGDGDPELAVGRPDIGSGSVEVYRSTGRDLDSTPVNTVDGAMPGDELGAAIAVSPIR